MRGDHVEHIEKELLRKQLMLVGMIKQINGLLSVPNAVNTDDYRFLKTQYASVMREIKELKDKRDSFGNAA